MSAQSAADFGTVISGSSKTLIRAPIKEKAA